MSIYYIFVWRWDSWAEYGLYTDTNQDHDWGENHEYNLGGGQKLNS